MADSKANVISLNDLTVETVTGESKKSGRPYAALRLSTQIDGEDYATLVFVNKVKK